MALVADFDGDTVITYPRHTHAAPRTAYFKWHVNRSKKKKKNGEEKIVKKKYKSVIGAGQKAINTAVRKGQNPLTQTHTRTEHGT